MGPGRRVQRVKLLLVRQSQRAKRIPSQAPWNGDRPGAMIGFAFVRDHTPGAPPALVMLVIFALDVPVINAFAVARYSSPPHAAS